MKTINAFVAADEELRVDRDAFVSMIEDVNQVLAPRNVKVVLDVYDADLHNEILDKSQIAFVLYHASCRLFGPKQVDDAYARTVSGLNPQRLYIFFKDDESAKLDEEFMSFRNSFVSRFEHFFCSFRNVDTLKLNFMLSIENILVKEGGEAFLELKDADVKVEGLTIGSFRNLSIAEKNKGLSALLNQMDEVREKFERQKIKVGSDPDSEDLFVKLQELSSQVDTLQARVDRELLLSFNLAKRVAGVAMGETNEILVRAKASMEQGKIEEAIEILDSADSEGARSRLLRQKGAEVDEAKLELRSYSSLVGLELFRADALMRYEAIPMMERTVKVRQLRDDLLAELTSLKENSSVQLSPEIDGLMLRVKRSIVL